jgi:hypothetical protein
VSAGADELAAAVASWTARLDGFCAELESKGFRIQRDGFNVVIETPEGLRCRECGGPACEGCGRCLRLSKDNPCQAAECACD